MSNKTLYIIFGAVVAALLFVAVAFGDSDGGGYKPEPPRPPIMSDSDGGG